MLPVSNDAWTGAAEDDRRVDRAGQAGGGLEVAAQLPD